MKQNIPDSSSSCVLQGLGPKEELKKWEQHMNSEFVGRARGVKAWERFTGTRRQKEKLQMVHSEKEKATQTIRQIYQGSSPHS